MIRLTLPSLAQTCELDLPNSTVKECPIAALPDFLKSRPAGLARIGAALINRDDEGVKIAGQRQEFIRTWLELGLWHRTTTAEPTSDKTYGQFHRSSLVVASA